MLQPLTNRVVLNFGSFRHRSGTARSAAREDVPRRDTQCIAFGATRNSIEEYHSCSYSLTFAIQYPFVITKSRARTARYLNYSLQQLRRPTCDITRLLVSLMYIPAVRTITIFFCFVVFAPLMADEKQSPIVRVPSFSNTSVGTISFFVV